MRLLRDNWSYKLLALILSIALWADVKLHQEPYTQAVPVHLEVRGLSQDLVATTNVGQVTAVIYGPKVYVNRITPDRLAAYVDLRGAGPGQRRADVHVQLAKKLDPILTIQSVAPDKVDVRIRNKTSKSLPVLVKWTGAPAPGSQYGIPHITPATVMVSGADISVESVQRAVVTLEAGDIHISGRFPVVLVDEHGEVVNDVTASPDTVYVDVTSSPTQGRTQALVNASYSGLPAPGFTVEGISTNPQAVTLLGTPAALRSLTSIQTRPVDISGARHDIVRVVGLQTPPGVQALPNSVEVHIRIRKGLAQLPNHG